MKEYCASSALKRCAETGRCTDVFSSGLALVIRHIDCPILTRVRSSGRHVIRKCEGIVGMAVFIATMYVVSLKTISRPLVCALVNAG